jgi:hypothetical protein
VPCGVCVRATFPMYHGPVNANVRRNFELAMIVRTRPDGVTRVIVRLSLTVSSGFVLCTKKRCKPCPRGIEPSRSPSGCGKRESLCAMRRRRLRHLRELGE